MAEVNYKEFNNPRDNRLATEHELLDDFCKQSKLISYEAKKRKGGLPPERYLIHFKVKSIIGIDASQKPIYGEDHTAEIKISPEYPLGGQPGCYMTTPLWHPNIKFDGEFAGKICINKEALGHWHTMDMLAERIGEMLQYKNYHAINTPPYPEDAKVATWVRDFAEPMNIVNKKKGIFVDNRPLLEPSKEWLKTRKEKIEVRILNVRRNDSLSQEQANIIVRTSQPRRRQVTVNKKS